MSRALLQRQVYLRCFSAGVSLLQPVCCRIFIMTAGSSDLKTVWPKQAHCFRPGKTQSVGAAGGWGHQEQTAALAWKPAE